MLVEEDEELCKLSSSTNRSLLQQYKQSIGDSEGTVQTDQGSDAILRKMLIDTFIEEAQLCKSINSLTCNAITSRGSRKLDLM